MTVKPEDLTLVRLRSIDAKLDRLVNHASDLTDRMGHVESHLGTLSQQYAVLSARMDGFDRRLGRVEARLNLGEG
ncbi:MAG: hypothetical protein AAF220_10870 [Pseudomonadota bacterium]